MVPAPGSRVVLLSCGSFNPPTFMHMRMMEVAKHALETKHGLSVLQGIMSPVSDGYGKAGLVSADHRINMLTVATSSSDWIISDPWEALKPAWTRTVATLQYHTNLAKQRFGSDVKVVLVAGTDVVESFKRILPNGERLWKKKDLVDILTSHGVVCLVREGARPHVILEEIDFLREHVLSLVEIEEDVCPNMISSTRIRAAIAEGKPLKYAVEDGIINYIKKYELYSKKS